MKKIFSPILAYLLTSCTSVKVHEVNSSFQVNHVCIQENSKVIVEDFLPVVRRGFERHGITTEIYQGLNSSRCEYYLTYTALKTWDVSMYMHHAELSLFRGHQKIGYAEYHLNGEGGLALNKWASVESKMNPVIDKLLSHYSPNITHSSRRTTQIDSEKTSDKTAKLRELKQWFDESLISEKEYNDRKHEILKE